MCKRTIIAMMMVFVTALAFTGPAVSKQNFPTGWHSSQL